MPESADWRIAVTPPYAVFLKFVRGSVTFRNADDIDTAIRFIAAESIGMGHGRFRARLCRLLKHANLTSGQRRRLGDAIGRRLLAGRFSEHFFCQLRALARIDYAALRYWCERALDESPQDYVHRFANRALLLAEKPVLSPAWTAEPIATPSALRGRPRWVPQSAREAKNLADSAGRQLCTSLWSTGNARAWAVISARLDARRDHTVADDKISDELLHKLANENAQLANAIRSLQTARAQFAKAITASFD